MFFKKHFLPFLIILLIALIDRFFLNYLGLIFKNDIVSFISSFCYMILLFALGISFNYYKKAKNQRWLRKVIISLLLVLLFLYKENFIYINFISISFNALGINNFIINLLYIYLGYIFFD